MIHIIFRDIFVCYFSRVIILIFVVLVCVWCVLHYWVLDYRYCALNTHSCVTDVHYCAFHIYCCICITGVDVILYCVQYLCFFSGPNSRYLVYIVIIHCLLFVILWRIVGIFGSIFMGCVGAGDIFIGCASFFVIEALFIGCFVTIIIIIFVVHSCGDVMCIDIVVVYF